MCPLLAKLRKVRRCPINLSQASLRVRARSHRQQSVEVRMLVGQVDIRIHRGDMATPYRPMRNRVVRNVEDISTPGSSRSLKHCRLDALLMQRMHTNVGDPVSALSGDTGAIHDGDVAHYPAFVYFEH